MKRITERKKEQLVLGFVEERGKMAFEIAKRKILGERIGDGIVREAIDYYVHNLWFDVHHAGMLYLACEAVGGNGEKTILVGASTILLRGGIDIHDDIIDDQKTKAGKATVYGKYGVDIAVLAGNAMLFEGFALLDKAMASLPSEKRKLIFTLLRNAFFEIGNAITCELELRKCSNVSPEEYFSKIIEPKAVGVEVHMKIGAIMGNGTRDEIARLAQFGRTLGILATVRDEKVDVYEPEELLGRATREVVPLPILYVFKDERKKRTICRTLAKRRLTQEDVDRMIDEISTSIDYQKFRKELRGSAENSLQRIYPLKETKAKNILKSLVPALMIDL